MNSIYHISHIYIFEYIHRVYDILLDAIEFDIIRHRLNGCDVIIMIRERIKDKVFPTTTTTTTSNNFEL